MLPVPSASLGGIGGIEFPTLPPQPSGPNPTAPGSFSGLYDRMLTGADRMAASLGASKPPLPTSMEMRPIMAPNNDLSQPFVAGKEFPGAVDPNALRLPGSSNAASAGDRPTHPYAEMLSPLSNGLTQVNSLQKDAEGLANEAALGGDVDLHDVMIAGEKASVAMQLTLQVRNKLVEAYQEVMRMQV